MTAIAYEATMSSSDALIWNIERDPLLRSTVMSVWFLDRAPTADRALEAIGGLVGAVPRLRQRVVAARPRPRWDAVEPDLGHHMLLAALPDRPAVLELAEAWVAEPFDADRPLWRIAVVSLDDGTGALIIKVHHTIADGMALVMMLAALVDFDRNPPARIAERLEAQLIERRRGEQARIAARVLRKWSSGLVTRPIRTMRAGVRGLTSAARLVAPTTTPCSSLMTGRSTALSLHHRSLPLSELKTTARHTGATLNDAFVAIVLDAIRRYHDELGHMCERLRVHMPINIRTAATANVSGNQFVPARIVMDTGGDAASDRIRRVQRRLAHVRQEPALPHVNTVSAAIQKLGVAISRRIVGGMMKGVDVLASNVPGPPMAMYVAGARIDEFYAFGPPAGAALNVTLFSYDGTVSLGISLDRAAVTAPERFLRCLDEAIAATLAVIPVESVLVAA